MKDAIVIIML